MKIRELKPEDWELLKSLMVESCNESPDSFTEIPNVHSPDSEWIGRARIWSQDTQVTFILYNDEGQWGILKGSTNNIGHFWISTKFRGDKVNKFGQQLLKSFLDWAKRRRAKCISLYVKENSKAIESYEFAGFSRTGDVSGNWIEMKLMI